MNRCAYQQRNFMAAGEESEIDSMIFPKPRRFGVFNPSADGHEPIRPQRFSLTRQAEVGDSTGAELLDMILAKGRGEKLGTPVALSPPFFSGSPPSRTSNPVVRDARFCDERAPPPFCPAAASPSPSSCISGGCTRVKFGQTPAAVRVEGFDCHSRDRRSISAMA